MKVIEGTVVVLDDNVGANSIIAPEYSLGKLTPEAGEHVFPKTDFSGDRKIYTGAILVAGEKFGHGSAREQVVLALQQAGVKAMIARSFAPPFFRNAVNQGLPVFVSTETVESVESGDELRIDFEAWSLTNLRTGDTFSADPLPEFVRKIVDMGGVSSYMKEMIGRSAAADGR